jgi:hypothetical protein
MTFVRERGTGMSTSDLVALKAERERSSAATPAKRVRTSMSRGWTGLRGDIEAEFRALGAKVFREEKGS